MNAYFNDPDAARESVKASQLRQQHGGGGGIQPSEAHGHGYPERAETPTVTTSPGGTPLRQLYNDRLVEQPALDPFKAHIDDNIDQSWNDPRLNALMKLPDDLKYIGTTLLSLSHTHTQAHTLCFMWSHI